MIQIRLEDIPEIPIFTAAELLRVDRVYRELRRKHDAVCKAGVKRPVAKPADWDDLQDKKIRDAEVVAGTWRTR